MRQACGILNCAEAVLMLTILAVRKNADGGIVNCCYSFELCH